MSDALERLIQAVEAGAWDGSWRGALDADKMMPPQAFSDAYHGSLDAALRLLAALLPDHDWGRAPGGQMWVTTIGRPIYWSGDGHEPVRGLLLAILRAKLAEANNVTTRDETAV